MSQACRHLDIVFCVCRRKYYVKMSVSICMCLIRVRGKRGGVTYVTVRSNSWGQTPTVLTIFPHMGRGVEYMHRFPACRMRRQKRCPDGSASTAWDYAGLLCSLYSLGWRYQDADPKRCHYSQTSHAHSKLFLHMEQHVADWVPPFPHTQHSPPFVQILPFSPFTSPPSSSSFYMYEN